MPVPSFWGLPCDGTPQPTGGSLPTADASPRPSESGSDRRGGAPPGPHTGHSQAVLTDAQYLKLHVHYAIAAGPCVIDKSPAAPVNSPCLSTAADVSTTSWHGFLRANKLPLDRNGLADGSGLEVTAEPGSRCWDHRCSRGSRPVPKQQGEHWEPVGGCPGFYCSKTW